MHDTTRVTAVGALLWVAAAYLALSSVLEKRMLLRCCRQPPAFSADLPVAAAYALPAAVLAHCVLGAVMLSDGAALPSPRVAAALPWLYVRASKSWKLFRRSEF